MKYSTINLLIYICGDSKVRQEGNGTRNHVRQVDVCA